MEGSQRSETTPRKPVELEVDCATEEMTEPVTLTTGDVGVGGLFIKTEFPLQAGTRFGCRFHAQNEAPILAECEVVWVRAGAPDSQSPAGMGVRFVALDPSDLVRLRRYVTGEADVSVDEVLGREAPRVTFRLNGVGRPVPGEYRVLSEDGMSAVAELPFLQVGATVQVTIDEPGNRAPRAGRIAWLQFEEDPEADTNTPRIRLGINFSDAEAIPAPEAPVGIPREPVLLTDQKRATRPEPPAAQVARPASASSPAEPAKAATPLAAPWEPATAKSAPPSIRPRRRVRSRNGRGTSGARKAWHVVRSHAARNPKVALGIIASAALLVLVILTAVAFSGSSKSRPGKKPKAAQAATAPTSSDALAAPPTGVGPASPALPMGTAAAPTPAGASAPPPLPTTGDGGRSALAAGPGAQADPGKVLAGNADAAGEVLADPAAKSTPTKIHTYSLGRKFVVKLATKGKPRSVKHYLLAKPDGAVIDVTGTSPTLKPGRYKVKDGRVKFVKVLHRGRAARFIVYYGDRVKQPKIQIMPTEDSVNFVLTTRRPFRSTKARIPPRKVARKGLRPSGRKAPAMRIARGKLRRTRPGRLTRTPMRPLKPMRKRPAPIADATDD